MSTLEHDLVLLCTLESVSPVLFPTLMLTQETFSILPQERLGKLLSSGLKVSSLYSFSSSVGSYDWCGGHNYTTTLRKPWVVARIRLQLIQNFSVVGKSSTLLHSARKLKGCFRESGFWWISWLVLT